MRDYSFPHWAYRNERYSHWPQEVYLLEQFSAKRTVPSTKSQRKDMSESWGRQEGFLEKVGFRPALKMPGP